MGAKGRGVIVCCQLGKLNRQGAKDAKLQSERSPIETEVSRHSAATSFAFLACLASWRFIYSFRVSHTELPSPLEKVVALIENGVEGKNDPLNQPVGPARRG